MSTSMTFGRAGRLNPPRGAIWFAAAASGVINLIRKIDQWQLSQSRHEPQTAEEVLDWARHIEHTDPGFASDLRAAVLRSQDRSDA